MEIFFILVGISVVGIVAVFLLLRREEQAAGVPLQDVLESRSALPTVEEPAKIKKKGLFIQ